MTVHRQTDIDTVVIGAGQAGLSVGYHLSRLDVPFVILDAARRTGDSWRERWDSLRLNTPARYDGLDGMPFPAPSHYYPTKDEMADYLETYAKRFDLPVRNGVRVERLTRVDGHLEVITSEEHIRAHNVVVAMSSWQKPSPPSLSAELSPEIRQLHSADYRNPAQLLPGPVLVVGAGNSGAEIAMEVSRSHPTLLSGPDVGHVPFRVEGRLGRLLVPVVLRFLFHRVLTTATPIGRRARPRLLAKGEDLVRIKPADLADAGVERVGRVTGARNGLPLVGDRAVETANVIWCTGYTPGFSWIELPVMVDGHPRHQDGVVSSEPGLFFVGLKFLHAVSSAQVHGVGRDAARVARIVARRLDGADPGGRATPSRLMRAGGA